MGCGKQDVEVLGNAGPAHSPALWAHDGSEPILGSGRPWGTGGSSDRIRASLAGLAHKLASTGPSSLPGLHGPSRQRLILSRIVAAAVSGDVNGFTADLGLVGWPGAWPQLFREIVRVGFVHTSIRMAFCEAWRGSSDMASGSDILAERMGWSLTRDFKEHPDLLVAGLRLLVPEAAVTRPVHALYRGQSLAEHQAGRHGCWWTPEPVHAELFALMPNRTRSGPGAVVVTFAPGNAIITALCRTEFLVKRPADLHDIAVKDLKLAFADMANLAMRGPRPSTDPGVRKPLLSAGARDQISQQS